MQSSLELFQDKAKAVGAEVHYCASKRETLESLLDLLRIEGVADAPGAYAVWASDAFCTELDHNALSAQVPGLRFDVTRELASQAKIGISRFDWAIADTGTLVVDATAVDHRLVSSLPPIHVALVDRAKLLPDLATAVAKISPARMAYVSLITGPSRTADIERVLTIGVHGPGRLIVLIFDAAEGAAA